MQIYVKIERKITETLEDIQEIHQYLLEKVLIYHLDKNDTNDKEFYYAVGQLFHYLFSLGYNQNVNTTNLDPSVIKRGIEKFMKKYAHDIKIKDRTEIEIFRFANLLSLIFAHQSQNNKILEDYFLAGLDNEENVMFYEEK